MGSAESRGLFFMINPGAECAGVFLCLLLLLQIGLTRTGKPLAGLLTGKGRFSGFGRMLRDFPMGFSVGNRGAGPLYGTAG